MGVLSLGILLALGNGSEIPWKCGKSVSKGCWQPRQAPGVQERGGRDGKLNPDKEEWAQLIPLARGRVWELVGLSLT